MYIGIDQAQNIWVRDPAQVQCTAQDRELAPTQVGNVLQHRYIHGSSRMYCEVKYTVHVSSAKVNGSSW